MWALTDRERQALGIEPLPTNLSEAIRRMEGSELVAETLGEHVFDFFLRNKRAGVARLPPPGHAVRARPLPRRCCDRLLIPHDRPRVLVVQHEPDTGPGWFGDWLSGAGLALDVVHPYAGDELPAAAGVRRAAGARRCDGAGRRRRLPVAAGDPGAARRGRRRRRCRRSASAWAPSCWRSAAAARCAAGCAGPELGVLGVDLAPAAADDPVFGALRGPRRVVQWHWEEIADAARRLRCCWRRRRRTRTRRSGSARRPGACRATPR